MKTIAKTVEWEDTKSIFNETITIVTTVLDQDGIYFDPSYEDFLEYIFRKFAKERIQNDSLNMKLSKKDIFFFHENANSYLLNLIYIELFGSDEKENFDTTIYDKEDGYINLASFLHKNHLDKLIEIIDELKINFKDILNNTSILDFPKSLDDYNEYDNRLINFRYQSKNFLS